MSNIAECRRLIPDGRIRINQLLTEEQKAAVTALRLDGLTMLTINETKLLQPETWIEYWFERDKLTEDDLRSQINKTLINLP